MDRGHHPSATSGVASAASGTDATGADASRVGTAARFANPCIGCGACCASYRVAFHWSETTDCASGVVPTALVEPLRRHEVAMRGTSAVAPRCVALQGGVGTDARCGIHGRHPTPCRALQPGEAQCRRARERHGLPALAVDPSNDQGAGQSARQVATVQPYNHSIAS